MFDKNKEILGYLNYYFSSQIPPQYAVMLKGRWGTGKTWFIEKAIEDFKRGGGKLLYISLYGVVNLQQIDDEFFRQLHPVMGSKGAAFAGRLIKGLVKGTLKIDFDGDKKDDGTATVGIPELGIPEYLRDTNGLVLVFDDLERCSLPITDVMGYINYFVEHDGRKVVIICNEEEIIRSEKNEGDDQGISFKRIKEKLVGKTFEITADFSSAVDSFIDEVDLESSRELLDKHKELVKQIYSNAGYKNLRHLRQAILDISRLIEILDLNTRKHDRLIAHLFSFFFLYSFEIKSGKLSPDMIGSVTSVVYASLSSKKKADSETLHAELSRKYAGLSLFDSLLPVPLWASIFETGLFDVAEINRSLKNSKYFVDANQPDWVRLWNMFSLTDDDLDEVISAIDIRFRKHEITELGPLRHVVASLMLLSELGIYPHGKNDIAEIGHQTLEHMKADGSLRMAFLKEEDFLRGKGFAGMIFHRSNGNEFSEFLFKLKEQGREAVELGYPEEAKELLQLLGVKTDDFCASLVLNNYKLSKFKDVPILAYLLPQEFVDAVMLLKPEELSALNATLRARYEVDHNLAKLKIEGNWLSSIAPIYHTAISTRTGKMSGVLLGHIEKTILGAAAKFSPVPPPDEEGGDDDL